MDCRVHGISKSQTQLRDFSFHFHGYSYLNSTCAIVCVNQKVEEDVTEDRKKGPVQSQITLEQSEQ